MPPALAERLDLSERIAPVLASGLSGNPRQCKRFLNTLVMRLDMADSRKVTLQEGVLAKLMLLEHFRPAWFRRLPKSSRLRMAVPRSFWPLSGSPQRQRAANSAVPTNREKRRSSAASRDKDGSVEGDSSLDGEFLTWLTDSWMKDWASAQPALGSIDLRPYFFFSRDKLGAMGSPAA